MRKFYVTAILILLSWVGVNGQSTANYTFATGANSSLAVDRNSNTIDMATGTTQLVGAAQDAAVSGLVSLPFEFYFLSTRFTQFSVNEDGILQLGGTAVGTNLYTLTAGTLALPRFSAFNADLRTGTTTGKIHYKTVGTAPNRTLVVEFTNMQLFYTTSAAAGSSTWQMRFYETSGIVEYVYGTMNVSSVTAGNKSPSIGFYAGSATGSFGSVLYAGNTYGTTNPYAPNPAVSATGDLPSLHSTANGSRRYYAFIPPGNTGNLITTTLASPTGLNFTAVASTAMTLNWTASAPVTGVRAYAIYISTDNVTFTYLTQVTVGTNTYVATGLTPSTPYYWKVHPISEGAIATALAGSQATAAPATYYWVGATNGTWSTAANWNTAADGSGTTRAVPATTDALVIDGALTTPGAAVTINVDAAYTIGQLKITSNTSASLQASTAAARTLTISGGAGTDFVVEAGSTLSMTNAANAVAIAFTGTGNTGDISGTITFGGLVTNALNTTGGTGTLVNVSSTGIINLGAPGNSVTSTAATLNFANGSNCNSSGATTGQIPVPLATWGATSNLTITGVTSSTTTATNNVQTFGNFTYNCPAATATMSFFTTSTTAVIQGNLNIIATNTGTFRALTSGILTVNGNVIITAGNFDIASTSGTLRVKGNFIQNGGIVVAPSTTSLLELNGTTAQTLTLISGAHGTNTLNLRVNNAAGVDLTAPSLSARNITISLGNITGAGSIAYATTSVLTYNSTTGNQTATTVEFPAASGPGSLTNNNTSGLPNNVLTIPFSRALNGTAGILTLTAGTIDNTGFVLSVPNTSTTAITGASATTYLKGALERNLPASLTGTLTYNFPVGKGTYNNLELVNPVTNAGGTVTVRAEAFDAATGGTAGANMTSLSTNRYWAASITAGSANFTSTLLRLNDVPGTANAIAAASTLTGTYDLAGGLTPTVGAGSILTTAPALTAIGSYYVMGVKGVAATYVSSTTTQAIVTPVIKPATNQQIIGVQIVTSGNLSPLTLANLGFSTNGSTNASVDISAARVFYTGTTNTFSTTTQFGADVTSPSGAFTVSGSQVLAEGINYFWLVYDVPAGATLNNLLDAECTQIDYGVTQVPTVTAPTGTRIIKGPLHGTYLIGPSQVIPNYTKLTDAIADLNLYGADAAVTFALASDYVSTSETFPLVISAYPGNSSTNSLTIRPNTGVTSTISASNSTAIFTFNGARYVTIDGSNTVGGTTRNLTIANTSTSGTTIRFINGSQFSGVKNSTVTGVVTSLLSAVIYIGTASASSGNNNITIQNNAITKGASLPGTAILNSGTSSALANTNVLITGNSISDFATYGVYDEDYSSNLTVSNNLVFGTVTQTNSSDLYGIYIEGSNITLPVITGNKVYDLKSTNTSSSTGIVHGIDIYDMAAGTTCLVANNMVSLSGNGGGAPGVRLVGIADEPTSGTVNLYYNTVSITGTASSGSASFAYLKNFTNVSNLRNNIFSNTRTSSGSANQYAIAFSGGGTINSNYNDLYSGGNALNILGSYNSTNQATLAAWQTASSGDANSVNVLPVFIASNDLHLNKAQNYGISNLGTAAGGIGTDIDGDTRNATTPDMGADEFSPCTPAPLADITTAPVSASICIGESITLTESGGTATSWLWSTGATTQAISVSPTVGTTYTVTATVSAGCDASASKFVLVNPVPAAVSVTPAAPSVCAGESVLLTASGGIARSLFYTASATLNTAIPDQSTTGISNTLTVSGIPAAATVDSLIVTLDIAHTFNSDVQVNLVSPNGQIINLVKDNGLSTDNFTNSRITSDDSKSLLIAGNGMTGTYRATKSATVYGLPAATTALWSDMFAAPLNGNWTLRVYDDGVGDFGTLQSWSIAINYKAPAAFTWAPVTELYTDIAGTVAYTGAATATVYSKPTAIRTYTVTATSASNCTATANVTVTPSTLAAGATHTNVNCFGGLTGSITASATGGVPGYTYSIDNVTYGTATLFSGLAAGTYTVYVKDNNGTGCTATTSVVITQPASAVAISVTNQADPVCAGGNTGTITVAGSGGTGALSYSINGGASQPSGAFTGLTAGNYIVTVTDANSCTATTSTITLTDPAPITLTLSSNSPVCQGGNITLTATAGGTSYSWSGPNGYANTTTVNTVTIPAVLAADGIYSVTMTNAQNCSNTATTTVIVTPTVNVSVALATNTGVNVCSGLPVTFTATPTNGGSAPIYTFNVNGTDQQTGPSATYTYNVTTNDVVHVTLVSDVACGSGPATSADITMNVTASVAAAVSLASDDADNTVCAGTTVTYTATPVTGQGTAPTYEFFVNNVSQQNGAGTSFSYAPVNGDAVRVVMTSNLACATGNPASSGTINMVVNALPATPTITAGGTTTFCAGGTVTLTSTTATGYLWSNGATTQSITVGLDGSYTVTTSNGTCQSAVSNTIVVTVNSLPAIPTIATSGSTSFCTGGSVTLTSTPSTNILWSSGQTTASISVNTGGSYTVTYTDGNGCSSTSAATVVTVNDLPSITSVTADCANLYPGGTVNLTVAATAGSGTITNYQWVLNGTTNVGTNSPTLAATAAGSYTVTVTNSSTCSITSGATVVSALTGALAGTYNIGGGCGFPTMASAVNYLNANGVSAAVTFNVLPAYTAETAPAGGYVIGGAGSAILSGGNATSATNTVTFNGGNITVTAPGQAAGSLNDAVFKLVGADWITLSGFTIRENAASTDYGNTTNNATEWGIALLYNSATDGAQNNTIQSNNVQLNRSYPNSIAFYSNTRHTPAAPTAIAEITAASGSNSNNKIYTNTISNVNTPMLFIGAAAAALMDNQNDIGGTASGTGNTISNWGSNTAATATFAGMPASLILGINTVNQTNVNISYNSLVSAAMNNNLSPRGIMADYTVATSGTIVNNITNNTVSMSQASTLTTGTSMQAITTTNTSAVVSANVTYNLNNNNIINNVISGTASAASLFGVANLGAFGTVNMNGNIIRSNTSTATTGGFIPLTNQAAVVNAINFNNNQIGNASGNAITFSAATAGPMYGIFNSAGAATSVFTATGNDVQGMVQTVAGTTANLHAYIYNGASTLSQNISNNTFTNITARTVGQVIFIFLPNTVTLTSTGVQTIDNNRIVTAFSKPTAGNSVIFVASSGNSAAGASINWTNNIFSNVTVTGATVVTGFNNIDGIASNKNVSNNTINNITGGSSAVTGIVNDYGGGAGDAGNITSGNTVSNITGSGAITAISTGGNATSSSTFGNTISALSTTGGSAVTGILSAYLVTGSGSVYKNKIFGLSGSASGSTVNALTASSGATQTIYNNIIGDLNAPISTGTNQLRGINITGSTNVNVYNNTVYLGAVTSSAATFGTSALSTVNAVNLTMRNNILVNLSTPKGTTGFATAFRKSTTALATYQASSDNNLFYAGTPSANKVLMYDGTNGYQTLAALKAFVAPREGNSVTENPTFLSTTGAAANYLHIDPSVATLIESGGLPIAGITDDYDGDVRNTSTPDIGADEFAGLPISGVKINSVTPSLAGSQCNATARTITANITAGTSAITSVTLYYTVNGAAAVAVPLTDGSFTAGSTSDFHGTIPVPVPANAIITWWVTAVDAANSKTLAGATYQDAPLTGITLTASALPATVCDGSSTSLSVVMNTAAAVTTYTTPSVSTPTGDEDLGNVSITQGAVTILSNTSTRNSLAGSIGTATGTAGSYSNFTGFGPYPLSRGTTYTFSATTVDAAGGWGSYIVAQIDYNRNGVFTDAGETIHVPAAASNGVHTETSSFTVPATAPFGKTRMRVFVNESTTISTNPSISWGEYEDYMINIAPSFTYSWANGATPVGTGTPVTVTPSGTTTYTVTGTDAVTGCSVNTTVLVNVNPLPAAPTTAPSTQCGAGVPTAAAAGATNGQYRWYTVSSGGTAIAGEVNSQLGTTSVSTTTTFYVSINNGTCEGPRATVVANVSAADAITAAVDLPAVCPNSPINLTVTKAAGLNNYTYTWTATPAAGSGIPTSITGDNINVTPTASGSYTYNVSGFDAVAGCTATSTVNVTVNAVPVILTATASPAVICEGGSTILTATTSIIGPGLATVGAGTILNTQSQNLTTDYPAPFGNYWFGAKNQFLITAAELTAAGLRAGNITSLAFDVATPVTTSLTGFNVAIASTNLTALSAFQTGLTTVFGPAVYAPVATTGYAANTINFSTPFAWDGTSNLIIQTCFNNTSATTNAVFRQSATTYNSTLVRRADNATVCASAVVSTTYTQRPNMRFGGTTLTEGAGTYTWTWNPGNLPGNTVTVTPASTTLYTVTASNGSCANTATVNVTVNPLPNAPTASNSSQCGTQVPTASVADVNGYTTPTFNWYAASSGGTALQSGTSATYTSTVSATTTFWVSVSNPVTLCESARTPVTVTITAAPSITVSSSAPGNTVCAGSAVTLTASSSNPGYTYNWQAPISAAGAVQSVSPTITTKYKVTASDISGGPNAGCAITDSITITVVAIPLVTVTPTDATICGSGPAVQLSALGTGPLLFSENFEGGGLGAFTVVNDVDNETNISDWKGQASPYNTGGDWDETLNSGSNRFALANSDAVGDELFTWTNLESPSINASNYSTLALNFRHYFAYLGFFGAEGYVSVSTNGGATWTVVEDYLNSEGAPTSFANAATINLDAYAGNTNLKFRFEYLAIWDLGWAIDDVALTGTPITTSNVTWSPTAGLFTNAAGTIPYTGGTATTVYANPAVTTTYTASADNGSCIGTATATVGKNTTMGGVYTVGAGQAGPTGFNTLTAAVKAYNTVCSLTGPVTFSLVDATYSTNETFPITINAKSDATTALTIKPATGVNALITGSSATSLITLNGADYVAIDGSNTINGTTRNLTINNNNIGASVGIWISSVAAPLDGATFNTIKNTNVEGLNTVDNVGSIASMGSTYLDLADAPNSNNSLINNSLTKGQEGLLILGNATSPDVNWQIRKNTFGSSVATSKLSFDGIYIGNVRDYVIDSNIVAGVSVNTTSSIVAGMTLEGTHLNGTITNNKISDIKNTNVTGYGSAGIRLNASTTAANVTVANNFISDIASTGSNNFTSTRNGNGLVIDGGGGYKIYFNTVVLNSEQTNGGNHRAAALFVGAGVTTAASLDIRNNIFGNAQATGGANSRYAVMSTANNNVYALMDYNDYFSTGSLLCKGSNATTYNTLALLRTNLGNNLASVNIVPQFVSATDLHLSTDPAFNAGLNGTATPIAGITTDIDADFRNTINPDMGADEFTPCSTNTYTWIGKTSTDWNDPTNWCSTLVPTNSKNVIIPQGVQRYPVLGNGIPGTGYAADLTINTSATEVTIAPSGVLEVSGNFVNNAKITIDGTIRLTGTGAQTFPGPGQIGTTGNLHNFEVANTGAGVTIDNSFGITGQLLSTSGNMALGTNDVTIVSSAAATANVAPVTGTFSYGTGKFIVERFLPAKKAWRFLATPVTGSLKVYDTWQEAGLTPAGRGVQITGFGADPLVNGLDVTTPGYSLKYYDPAQPLGFKNIVNTRTTDLANEKGYMVFVRGDRTATVASGTNNLTVLRSMGQLITGTKTYTVPANGISSVGNPYASRIDLTKVYDNTGIGGASNVVASVTIWDPQVGSGVNGVGLYRTYVRNIAGDFEQTPSGTVNNFIESGQAFYVQSATGGTLTLRENDKITGSQNVSRSGNVALSRIRTNLYAPDADSGRALIDGTLIDTDPEFANAIDNMDARKTVNTGENFGMLAGGKNLIVERRKPFVATDTVFYNMSGMKQRSYELEFIPTNLAAPGLTGYLEDNFLHTSTPVVLGSNTRVGFTVSAVAGSAASNRFRLVFKQAVVLPVTITSISASRNTDRSIAVRWKVENEINIEKYTVERSADGVHFSGIITTPSTNSSSYLENDLSPLSADNYYRIKALSVGGQIQYSAIVKVAPLKEASSITVYPNPAVNKNVQVQFTNENGKYHLQLTTKLGQVLYNGTAQITGSSFVKSIELNKSVTAGTYQLKVIAEDGKVTTIQVVVE